MAKTDKTAAMKKKHRWLQKFKAIGQLIVCFEERKLKFTKVRASSNTYSSYICVCSVCVEYLKGIYKTNLQDF